MSLKFHPQRIAPIAAPGALLKRLHGLHVQARLKEIAGSDPVYLALIRQLPCLRCGLDPCGEAAHVRRQSAAHGKFGGIGRRPADRFALPLDGGCHREDADALHRIGEAEFFGRLGLDPLLVCQRLYAKRGDLVAMRAVALLVIAERTR